MSDNAMQRTDLRELERSVKLSLRMVSLVVALALIAYAAWFLFVKAAPLSDDPASWGQFGDFVGGILNPLVAYSAFYWLTRSVLLQKEELLETRKALEESAAAQTKHAVAAEASIRVAAFTALLNSAVTEVQSLRDVSSSLIAQAASHHSGSARLPSGDWARGEDVVKYVASLGEQIAYQSHQRTKIEETLRRLLKSASQETFGVADS